MGIAGAASHEDDNNTPRYLEQTSHGGRAWSASRVTYGLEAGGLLDALGADTLREESCGRSLHPRPAVVLGQGRAERRSQAQRLCQTRLPLAALRPHVCAGVESDLSAVHTPTFSPSLHPPPTGLSPTTRP